MPTIGDRLRAARVEKGMKQKELARLVGVKSPSAVTNWEKGTSTPDADMLVRLCEVLDTDLSYLLDYYGGKGRPVNAADDALLHKLHRLDAAGREMVETVLNLEYKRCSQKPAPQIVPLPTRPIRYAQYPVSAGTGVALDEEQFEAIDIPLTAESRNADFVLRVAGDSMEPEYHDGDLLLIQQADALEPGELGIFVVNGDGYFKRCGVGQIESLNPAYQPIRLTDSDVVQTVGRVIGTTEQV